jgi:6,7-dimethyl-8-ribityllumazine synthase
MKPKEGNGRRLPAPSCRGKRFAIIAARFHDSISDQLIDGARRALQECGVAAGDVELYDVPGCFEIPLACRKLIDDGNYDALVALGAVIRGETAHFEFVAGECARGIMDVQLESGVPIGFGVLTTDTLAQAQERADPARGDKGYEAAMAAAALVTISSTLPRAGFRG